MLAISEIIKPDTTVLRQNSDLLNLFIPCPIRKLEKGKSLLRKKFIITPSKKRKLNDKYAIILTSRSRFVSSSFITSDKFEPQRESAAQIKKPMQNNKTTTIIVLMKSRNANRVYHRRKVEIHSSNLFE